MFFVSSWQFKYLNNSLSLFPAEEWTTTKEKMKMQVAICQMDLIKPDPDNFTGFREDQSGNKQTSLQT